MLVAEGDVPKSNVLHFFAQVRSIAACPSPPLGRAPVSEARFRQHHKASFRWSATARKILYAEIARSEGCNTETGTEKNTSRHACRNRSLRSLSKSGAARQAERLLQPCQGVEAP